MTDERIKPGMEVEDILLAMTGDNPGAVMVCMKLLRNDAWVDPASPDGDLTSIRILDTLEIYGGRIWMFYEFVCGGRLGKMIAVLRAYQLGQLAGVNARTLDRAINNGFAGIDLDTVVEAVKSRLPNFDPGACAA